MQKVNGPSDVNSAGKVLLRSLAAPLVAAAPKAPPEAPSKAIPLSQSTLGLAGQSKPTPSALAGVLQ